MLAAHIFRAYDIRGIVGTDFDEAGAEKLGKAYATYLIRTDRLKNPTFAVGRDGRVSGENIKNAFVRGILSTGANVAEIGLSTSPLLFFSICVGKFDGGVNITASHNPSEYNGFKLQRRDAHSVCGKEIQNIFALCISEDFEIGTGHSSFVNCESEYFEKINTLVNINNTPKIVIDCGNGVAGKFAENLFTQLGCSVVPLFCEVDGTFPNHDADPEVEENLSDLKKAVLEHDADLGIAFDGDGDRLGIVDESGKHFSADLLLLVLARDLLRRHKNAKIVIDLKATQILFEDIKNHGGEGIMVKTGHSFVEEKMQEVGALLGGEVSGHLFFAERYYGFDDAFVAAAKILGVLETSQKSLAAHFVNLPTVFTTPEIKVECAEEKKFFVIDRLVALFLKRYGPEKCLTIDGVRIDFGDGAWGIVRASNTSPKITLRFEARNEKRLTEIQEIILSELRREISAL